MLAHTEARLDFRDEAFWSFADGPPGNCSGEFQLMPFCLISVPGGSMLPKELRCRRFSVPVLSLSEWDLGRFLDVPVLDDRDPIQR